MAGDDTNNHAMTRMASFGSWPQDAPPCPSVPKMVNDGWFHKGSAETECFRCRKVARNWSSTDDPRTRHACLCPECPVVLGTDTENVPMGSNSRLVRLDPSNLESDSAESRSAGPVGELLLPAYTVRGLRTSPASRHRPIAATGSQNNVAMRDERKRLDTFRGWQNSHVDPASLALAGFYFGGVADNTQCAFCQCMIGGWQLGDRPMIVHAREAPYCPFICGIDSGNIPIASLDETSSDTSSEASRDSSLNWTPNNQPGSQSSVDEQMIQDVIDTGLPRDVVFAVYSRKESGYGSANDLAEAVYQYLETPVAAAATPGIVQTPSDTTVTRAVTSDLEADSVGVEESAYSDSTDSLLLEFRRKNQKLQIKVKIAHQYQRHMETDLNASREEKELLLAEQGRMAAELDRSRAKVERMKARIEQMGLQPAPTCPVCLTEDANTVLLTCGHMVCNECAERLMNEQPYGPLRGPQCPACRQTITGTNRVWLP